MEFDTDFEEKFRKICGYERIMKKIDSINSHIRLLQISIQKGARARVQENVPKNITIQENMQKNGLVYIEDYPYHPKVRPSFANSKIKDLIARAVENSTEIDRIINTIKKYKEVFAKIPLHEESSHEPYWMNGWLPLVDGLMIYGMLAEKNPRWYVEVGSGNSTKFAAKAIRENNLRTQIISIDPHPRAEINALCHKIYRTPLEDMDLGFFSQLTEEDIFLLDNSHRAFPNSDVTVFFTEILPCLAKGLIYTLHDITLPDEIFVERFYNEQYMLATYLLGGAAGDEIYFPTGYLINHTNKLKELQDALMLQEIPLSGGLFWMKKH